MLHPGPCKLYHNDAMSQIKKKSMGVSPAQVPAIPGLACRCWQRRGSSTCACASCAMTGWWLRVVSDLEALSWPKLIPAGMQVLAEAGVFHLRLCKLCDDGVVVKGEYGLTAALFEKGYNIGTLMSKYPPGLDWRDKRHWDCNNNVHPSRHGELPYPHAAGF